jgi:hypothetical protein
LVLRFRLRVAIEDEANKDNLKALSELLKSIHEEERENLRILLDILDQELPKAIKALLQSPSREKRRYNTRPAPNNFKKNKPVKKGVPK